MVGQLPRGQWGSRDRNPRRFALQVGGEGAAQELGWCLSLHGRIQGGQHAHQAEADRGDLQLPSQPGKPRFFSGYLKYFMLLVLLFLAIARCSARLTFLPSWGGSKSSTRPNFHLLLQGRPRLQLTTFLKRSDLIVVIFLKSKPELTYPACCCRTSPSPAGAARTSGILPIYAWFTLYSCLIASSWLVTTPMLASSRSSRIRSWLGRVMAQTSTPKRSRVDFLCKGKDTDLVEHLPFLWQRVDFHAQEGEQWACQDGQSEDCCLRRQVRSSTPLWRLITALLAPITTIQPFNDLVCCCRCHLYWFSKRAHLPS